MLWLRFFFSTQGVINKIRIPKFDLSASVNTSILVVSDSVNNTTLDSIESPVFNEAFVTKKTIMLKNSQTLRLLSLELFGSKEFWVYIYQENLDVISDPNLVAPGIELVIPEKTLYDIDSNNPESIAKAKSIGEKILKEFVKG